MVNISIYIFGSFGNGYIQYPDNYAKDIYQNFFCQSTSISQIAIHRDKELMYYGYVRKLDNNAQYIGFCVLLNGMMFSNIINLFPIFENIVADIVSNGKILALNDSGDIVSLVDDFTNQQQEISDITSMIRNQIDGSLNNVVNLPPVNYSISNSEKKYFSIHDKSDDIVVSSYKYAYTYIKKEKGYNTSALLGYKGAIKKLHNEKNEISTKYNKLRAQYDKLNKQKKQYRNVIVLCAIVVLCGIGLFFLNDTLNNTQQTLEHSQNENEKKAKVIVNLNSKISTLNENIGNLKSSLSYEQEMRKEAENELDGIKTICEKEQPLFIKNTSFNFDTGWLYFDYYGYCDKNITLSVRAFNGNYSYKNSSSFLVEKGHHSGSIYLSRNLIETQWYSFELLIDNKIIGGDRH